MSERKAKCVVCQDRPAVGLTMCRPCGVSYDRSTEAQPALTTLEWAAKRARAAERRRWKESMRWGVF